MKEKELEQMNNATSSEARKGGFALFIGSSILIILTFFIMNPIVLTFNINKWAGGWVGIIWDFVLIGCILGGLYFLIIG